MFWECKHIQLFWSSFNSYFGNIFVGKISLTNILLGVDDHLKNTLIVHSKQFIYKSYYKEEVPIFKAYLCSLDYLIKTEKYISVKNTTYNKWLKIGTPFSNIIIL